MQLRKAVPRIIRLHAGASPLAVPPRTSGSAAPLAAAIFANAIGAGAGAAPPVIMAPPGMTPMRLVTAISCILIAVQ
jgi:hypothetical protein